MISSTHILLSHFNKIWEFNRIIGHSLTQADTLKDSLDRRFLTVLNKSFIVVINTAGAPNQHSLNPWGKAELS